MPNCLSNVISYSYCIDLTLNKSDHMYILICEKCSWKNISMVWLDHVKGAKLISTQKLLENYIVSRNCTGVTLSRAAVRRWVLTLTTLSTFLSRALHFDFAIFYKYPTDIQRWEQMLHWNRTRLDLQKFYNCSPEAWCWSDIYPQRRTIIFVLVSMPKC